MRPSGWLALFVTAVLGPLAFAALSGPTNSTSFAIAFGAALGWIAYGLLAVEFGLVSRLRAVAAAVGSDALLLFHRAMAVAAVVFVVGHAALLGAGWRTFRCRSTLEASGVLTLEALALVVLTSLARRRLRWSYELWLFAHRALAITVALAMLVHTLAALAPNDSVPRIAAIAYAGGALAALAARRLLRPLFSSLWEVVANRDEGASTHTLVLQAIGRAGLRFSPGQFVWLATGRRRGFAQEHPISIASSPELDGGRMLELAIKELGDWSREVVPHLKPGARVRIDGPFGTFSMDRVAAQRLVFVAGGIGVTPMRSMLLSMRARGDRRPATLFFAAHDRSRAMFADELESLQKDLDLRVVFVFEAPMVGEACETGFVTANLLRRHLPSDLRTTQFFVCGPAPMMDALESIVDELGLPASQLHTERFDMV